MSAPTLADHLRKATRHGSVRLPEDQVFTLGRDLARELARAHGETPPRHPSLEPETVGMREGSPRLDGSRVDGSVAEDLFHLGALLSALAGEQPHVSWRLDGPPAPPVRGLRRKMVLAALASPARAGGFETAAEALAALESALSQPAEGPAPWSTFRGNPGRTGTAGGASTTAAASLVPLWHARVGSVAASPALTLDLVLVPTARGRLVFVDRHGGRVVHELSLASATESSPAVAGGLLFAGTDDGELVAVDVEEGAVRYRQRLGSLVRSSPLVVTGRVLVGVVESKGKGALVALEAATGKPAWSRKLGAVFSSPAVAGTRVLVGSDQGALVAFDVGTGAPAWTHALGDKVRATPAVANGLAFVGDFAGRLAAVRVEDGSRAWTAELGHAMYSSPCLCAGRLVVGCHEGHLHGLDSSTGAPVFEAATHGPVVASATASGPDLVVGSTDGALYLLSVEGDVRQRLPLAAGGAQSSAAVDAGVAYVGSADGLHALRLQP